MSGITITITDAGRQEVINATNNGTAPVTIAEVGVGTGQYTPDPTQTTLQAETKRLSTIAGEVVAADTIHVTIKDETNDAYDVSEFGLYTDSGTLFAVYSVATGGPIMQKAAASALLLAVDIILSTLDATNVTFGDTSFANPPASETVAGVVELATVAETQTGTDKTRAVTPAGVASAIATRLAVYTSVPAAQAEDLIYVYPRGVLQWNATHGIYRAIECGQLVLHTGSTAKPGTVKANGALLSKTAYAGLWSQAQDDGLTVAAGNWVSETWQFEDYDANQFRVPDMRATFFRAWDDGRGVDSGRVFGSFQLGSLVIADKSSTLGVQGLHSNSTGTDNAASLGFDGINPSDYSSQIIEAGLSTGGSSSLGVNAVVGSSRPRNVALLACIKY